MNKFKIILFGFGLATASIAFAINCKQYTNPNLTQQCQTLQNSANQNSAPINCNQYFNPSLKNTCSQLQTLTNPGTGTQSTVPQQATPAALPQRAKIHY